MSPAMEIQALTYHFTALHDLGLLPRGVPIPSVSVCLLIVIAGIPLLILDLLLL